MKRAVLATLLLLAACDRPAQTAQVPAETPVPTPVPQPAPDASLPASPSSASPVRYFYFGNHVPRAEILSVSGADTASATLTGRTTAQDNYDYCVGYAGPEDTEVLTRCASERVEQPIETMTADCVARTVSDGSPAAWIRDDPAEGGKIRPVWRDTASGQIRDYSGAGGGYVLTSAFRILCPAASTNLAPDPR
ncbi:MAG: hypothetical protein V4701_02820 [Pseudomonadota bacterium]